MNRGRPTDFEGAQSSVLGWVGELTRDFRYALPILGKNPGFAALAVTIPAIAIGAATLMFSVLWGVVLQPLPDPARLVVAQALTDKGNANSLSAMDYWDYRRQCGAFESLAARASRDRMGRPSVLNR
jgi:putative ABC transport system permease protein